MDIEAIAKTAQNCFASNPVVILGSGASAPHGLPSMGELKDYLIEKIEAVGKDEEDAWLLIRTAFANGDHLEQALIGKVLPITLTKKIVALTWQCVNAKDREIMLRALNLQVPFPIGNLVSSLFHSSQKKIEIVTTNYDRVAEYACNSVGLIYSVGFMPGYIQMREGADVITFSRYGKPMRTVHIWKVHGSLDWFERQDSTPVSAPLFELPDNLLTPLIVTPGFNKFERTHDEPFRSAIHGADRALQNAESYLCIGFGFRDTHIEPKMLERCRQRELPVTVMGRTLTDEAKAFLQNKAGKKYLGLEMNGRGTRAYMATHPDGIDIPDQLFWSVEGFLKLVT